jgi:hypothetical protein
MTKIQEIVAKQKDGKYIKRYFITLKKEVVESRSLKKGDELLFNGEDRGELRFLIKRC